MATGDTTPRPLGTLTRKGAATRARLIQAAQRVFSERGFLQSKITDITAAAGTANGTFYTYFDSKEQVLMAIADEVVGRFLGILREGRSTSRHPAEVISHDNHQYVVAYRAHADIMRVIEQAATFNDEMAALRRSIRERFVARAARSIRTWQAQGLCRPDLTPSIAAALLVAMVDNLAYNWLSLGQPYPEDDVVHAMNEIWIRALRIPSATGTDPAR
ncbi:TetR/AcrR family transcriptional regulator [Streptomyces sp. NPDC005231]|uniref:TetR/AcrR family transcriptional regulator n=1 Tax=Streptomyces sp. NPDC005231 TaxID=3157026 RepID=UPI0033A4F66A